MVSTIALDPRGYLPTRENCAINPNMKASIAGWTLWQGTGGVAGLTRMAPGGGVAGGHGYVRAEWTTGTSAPSGGLIYTGTPIKPNTVYTFSAWVRFPYGPQGVIPQVQFYASGVPTGGQAGADFPVAQEVWTRVSLTATSGPNDTTVDLRLYMLGATATAMPATGLMDGDAVLIEVGPALGSYFDGDTPPAGVFTYAYTGAPNASTSVQQVIDPDTTTAAIFALGYEVERVVRTIVHDVPDAAAPPVTFKPAGPRSGTIQYLFSERETCRRAEIIHSRPGYITLTDTDWPDGPMRYVAQGEVVSRLDPETLVRWILEIGFTEV